MESAGCGERWKEKNVDSRLALRLVTHPFPLSFEERGVIISCGNDTFEGTTHPKEIATLRVFDAPLAMTDSKVADAGMVLWLLHEQKKGFS